MSCAVRVWATTVSMESGAAAVGGTAVSFPIGVLVGGVVEETAVATPISANIRFVPHDVLVGALQLKDLRPNIDQLFYRPSSGLSYQDGRGWRVYFGTGTDMAQKLVVYETIVEELTAQGLTPQYVSVSNQEKPYFLAQ